MKQNFSGNLSAVATCVVAVVGSSSVMGATLLETGASAYLVAGGYTQTDGTTNNKTATNGPRFVAREKALADSTVSAVAVYDAPEFSIIAGGAGAYANTDRVTMTVTGGTLRSTDIGVITCEAVGGSGTMTLTANTTLSSGNTVVLDVGNVVGNATGSRCIFPAGKFKILASSLVGDSAVFVSYAASPAAGGSAYDTLSVGTLSQIQNLIPLMFSREQYRLAPAGTANLFTNPMTNLTAASGVIATITAAGTVPFNARIGSSSTIFGGQGSTNPGYEATSTNGSYHDVLRVLVRNEAAVGVVPGAADGNTNLAKVYPSTTINTVSSIVDSTGTGVFSFALTGNFNFLDDNANGCDASDLTDGAGRVLVRNNTGTTTTAITPTINSTCTSLTWTAAIDPALDHKDRGFEVAFSLGGFDITNTSFTTRNSRTGRPIAAQTFALTLDVKSAAGAATSLDTIPVTAGAWTALSAGESSSVRIPYLPYGAGISRIVYVTSTDAAGTVATATAADKTNATLSFVGAYNGQVCASTNFPAVSLPSGGVVNIGGAIDSGLRACFPNIDADSGKAQVQVTATNSGAVGLNTGAPSFEISSAYNVAGNRNVVINQSNEQ